MTPFYTGLTLGLLIGAAVGAIVVCWLAASAATEHAVDAAPLLDPTEHRDAMLAAAWPGRPLLDPEAR